MGNWRESAKQSICLNVRCHRAGVVSWGQIVPVCSTQHLDFVLRARRCDYICILKDNSCGMEIMQGSGEYFDWKLLK